MSNIAEPGSRSQSRTDLTEAEAEAAIAKAFKRKPKLESTGTKMGLIRKAAPLESGAAMMAREAVTEAAREFLHLAQSHGGLSLDAAKALANSKVHEAYEQAAQRSHYDSERLQAAAKALESAGNDYKRKTPLVTESQAQQLRRGALTFTPERVTLNEADKGPSYQSQSVF